MSTFMHSFMTKATPQESNMLSSANSSDVISFKLFPAASLYIISKTMQNVKFIQGSFTLSMTNKHNVFTLGYEYMRFVHTPFEMPRKLPVKL